MFTGLRSIIYPSADLEADKKFWTAIIGKEPYFDQPFYVGFDVNGCELGLDPNGANEGMSSYPITYWRVNDTKEAIETILATGATTNSETKDVGGGMLMTTFKDLNGTVFGIIEHS